MADAAPRSSVRVASFKLQLAERRVRIVPAHDLSGRPFAGPGIDVVGDAADALAALAAPIVRWLQAREPVRVRSLSLDVGRGRLLVTLDDGASPAPPGGRTPGLARPRVVKIDPGVDAAASAELVALAAPLLSRLGELAHAGLVARATRQH